MSLVFALTAPEPVLVLIASEVSAHRSDRAAPADLASRCLATFAGLRSFGGAGKEQMGEPFARRSTHPVVVELYRCRAAAVDYRHE